MQVEKLAEIHAAMDRARRFLLRAPAGLGKSDSEVIMRWAQKAIEAVPLVELLLNYDHTDDCTKILDALKSCLEA